MPQEKPKDHWTHQAYKASASFVPELSSKVVEWLNPEPRDIILDLGCGDGLLTSKIGKRCQSVAGYDASDNLIQAAQESYGSYPNLTWHVQDCRYLEESSGVKWGTFTKVFSNAALHWILGDPTTRLSLLRAVAKALQPGGTFVFEMGGAGNVSEVQTALLGALIHQGLSIEVARQASPWFFPSKELMQDLLAQVGFEVQKSELEYRPTKLTVEEGGGLEGWVRLMGARFLEALDREEKRERAIREVCEVLESVIRHEEDGSMWMGYVRLRVLAKKIQE